MTEAGFVKHVIPKSEQDDMYQADDIELWELRLKSDASSSSFASDGSLSVKVLNDDKIEDCEESKRICRVQVGSCIYSLNRVSNGGIGGDLWASSMAMAEHLLKFYSDSPNKMKGLRVLELGSGIGLVALTCRQLGAQCVATDMAAVLPLLQENIITSSIESGSIEVVAYVWGDELCESLSGPFDLILCADCVYAHTSIEPLMAGLSSLTSKDTEVFHHYHSYVLILCLYVVIIYTRFSMYTL